MCLTRTSKQELFVVVFTSRKYWDIFADGEMEEWVMDQTLGTQHLRWPCSQNTSFLSPFLFCVTYYFPNFSMEENNRALLFNVKEPFEMTSAEFDDLWPLVSNVWVRWGASTLANGDSWKVWSCRFAKHNKSSTRQEGIPDIKRRKTMVREPGLCDSKIKVTHFVASQKVCICGCHL